MAGSAGVLPDIDEIKSYMRYRVWQFSRGFRGWIGLQNSTHSFGGLASGVMMAMCRRSWSTWILAGMIGWTCHLVLDALSGGIPLWWPFHQGQEYRWTLANWKMFGLLDYTLMLIGLALLIATFAEQQWLQVWIDLLKDDNVQT